MVRCWDPDHRGHMDCRVGAWRPPPDHARRRTVALAVAVAAAVLAGIADDALHHPAHAHGPPALTPAARPNSPEGTLPVKQIVRDRAPNQATLGRFARNVPAELAGAPLSHTALRVLLAYAAHANGGGYAWPGLRLLAAECALRSPSSVADAIAELVAAGWLVLHRPGAGRHASVYRVSWLTRGARLGITRGVARSARPHRRSARPRVVVARALGAQNKTIEQEHVEQDHRTPLGPPVHIIPPMARTDVPTWRWA